MPDAKNMPHPSARTGFVVGSGSKSQASPQIMLEHLNQLFKRTVSILNASYFFLKSHNTKPLSQILIYQNTLPKQTT